MKSAQEKLTDLINDIKIPDLSKIMDISEEIVNDRIAEFKKRTDVSEEELNKINIQHEQMKEALAKSKTDYKEAMKIINNLVNDKN